MNEQIEELVVKSGEKVLEWMDFAEGQAPVLTHEVLQWGFWFHGSVTLVCLLGLCAMVYLLILWLRFAGTIEDDNEAMACRGFAGVVWLVVASGILYGAIIAGVLAIKAALFPRLYLAEYSRGCSDEITSLSFRWDFLNALSGASRTSLAL